MLFFFWEVIHKALATIGNAEQHESFLNEI